MTIQNNQAYKQVAVARLTSAKGLQATQLSLAGVRSCSSGALQPASPPRRASASSTEYTQTCLETPAVASRRPSELKSSDPTMPCAAPTPAGAQNDAICTSAAGTGVGRLSNRSVQRQPSSQPAPSAAPLVATPLPRRAAAAAPACSLQPLAQRSPSAHALRLTGGSAVMAGSCMADGTDATNPAESGGAACARLVAGESRWLSVGSSRPRFAARPVWSMQVLMLALHSDALFRPLPEVEAPRRVSPLLHCGSWVPHAHGRLPASGSRCLPGWSSLAGPLRRWHSVQSLLSQPEADAHGPSCTRAGNKGCRAQLMAG